LRDLARYSALERLEASSAACERTMTRLIKLDFLETIKWEF